MKLFAHHLSELPFPSVLYVSKPVSVPTPFTRTHPSPTLPILPLDNSGENRTLCHETCPRQGCGKVREREHPHIVMVMLVGGGVGGARLWCVKCIYTCMYPYSSAPFSLSVELFAHKILKQCKLSCVGDYSCRREGPTRTQIVWTVELSVRQVVWCVRLAARG